MLANEIKPTASCSSAKPVLMADYSGEPFTQSYQPGPKVVVEPVGSNKLMGSSTSWECQPGMSFPTLRHHNKLTTTVFASGKDSSCCFRKWEPNLCRFSDVVPVSVSALQVGESQPAVEPPDLETNMAGACPNSRRAAILDQEAIWRQPNSKAVPEAIKQFFEENQFLQSWLMEILFRWKL